MVKESKMNKEAKEPCHSCGKYWAVGNFFENETSEEGKGLIYPICQKCWDYWETLCNLEDGERHFQRLVMLVKYSAFVTEDGRVLENEVKQ